MTEMHVLRDTVEYREILGDMVGGRRVLELGVGTGVLTGLLLDAGARIVVGYEVLPGVCDVRDPRFELRVEDYTAATLPINGFCLVANPAYSTLPFILENVVPFVRDVVLMVPSRCLQQVFALGFRHLFSLDGTAFEPAASGSHHVVAKGFQVPHFVDLHHACSKAVSVSLPERVDEIAGILPRAALCGIGGFPFKVSAEPNQKLVWCGEELSASRLRTHILDALGLSAVLTYTNKKNHSLLALGRICTDRQETWAYHWITATMVLAGHPPEVQLAFARDGRFRLGWTVEKAYTGKVFTASAELHAWVKFTSKFADESFDAPTRGAMRACHDILEGVLP